MKLLNKTVWFQILDFKTPKSNFEVSKSNSNIFMKNYLTLSKTTLLQREPFLTMFYNINSSPLIINKEVFMITIFL